MVVVLATVSCQTIGLNNDPSSNPYREIGNRVDLFVYSGIT